MWRKITYVISSCIGNNLSLLNSNSKQNIHEEISSCSFEDFFLIPKLSKCMK